jgi:hypothetical protein
MERRIVPDSLIGVDHTTALICTDDTSTDEVSGEGSADEISYVSDWKSTMTPRDGLRNLIRRRDIGGVGILSVVPGGESEAKE